MDEQHDDEPGAVAVAVAEGDRTAPEPGEGGEGDAGDAGDASRSEQGRAADEDRSERERERERERDGEGEGAGGAPGGPQAQRLRRWLLALAVARFGLSAVAVPLFPFLYREHFVLLVALRPSQGMLLAGGYLARQDQVSLLVVLAAAVPLQILAVWLYYAIGRAWADEIESDDELPFLAARLVRRDRVRAACEVLRERGPALVFLARFAVFPTGLVAAGAGAAGLPPARYIATDAAAALVATSASVGAGYGLRVAYDSAGPWLVVAGAAALVALSALIGTFVRRSLGV